MVAFNVEMISKEMIKPSSPTPHHLQNLKLSFLDQIAPPIYVPLIFFYQNDESNLNNNINHVQKSQLLKQSLSKILTHFYPLAGRIQVNSSNIDCNDEGAEFIEARVHARMTQVIEDPKMDELKQFLPLEPLGRTQKAILSVKLSLFDCGGIAVCVCLFHKIADGTSLVEFMKAWSTTCREEAQILSNDEKNLKETERLRVQLPSFNLAAHFPPIELSTSGVNPNIGITKEKITTKRLVFDKEKLAKLKQLAANGDVQSPSRVEAVSAFIWHHFIEASKARNQMTYLAHEKTTFVAVHAVNLRPRANPQIPQHAYGNCWRPAFAFLSKTEEGLRDLVTELRAGIRAIDEGSVKKVQNGEYLSEHLSKSIEMFKGDREVCNFSSWCRFPMYEVDFVFGKPVWVCTTTLPFKNLVILMSTPSGDGIEAWVNVPDHDLESLETHYNLLGSVSTIY